MSKLRTELTFSTKQALSNEAALLLIRDSVAKRKGLIHGRLNSGKGCCAMGAFFEDHPEAVLKAGLIDEVAAVNDSVPKATPRTRWKVVTNWLAIKIGLFLGKPKDGF